MNGLDPQKERIYNLERTIAAFKKYDIKRKNYIAEQNRVIENLRKRITDLEKLTEQQHEQIDVLIDSYDKANGMKDNSANKAYVKKLLDEISLLKGTALLPKRILEDESQLNMLKELASLRHATLTMRTTIKRLNAENELLRKQQP